MKRVGCLGSSCSIRALFHASMRALHIYRKRVRTSSPKSVFLSRGHPLRLRTIPSLFLSHRPTHPTMTHNSRLLWMAIRKSSRVPSAWPLQRPIEAFSSPLRRLAPLLKHHSYPTPKAKLPPRNSFPSAATASLSHRKISRQLSIIARWRSRKRYSNSVMSWTI